MWCTVCQQFCFCLFSILHTSSCFSGDVSNLRTFSCRRLHIHLQHQCGASSLNNTVIEREWAYSRSTMAQSNICWLLIEPNFSAMAHFVFYATQCFVLFSSLISLSSIQFLSFGQSSLLLSVTEDRWRDGSEKKKVERKSPEALVSFPLLCSRSCLWWIW